MSAAATTDRWFHDEADSLVVFQRPNLPLVVGFAARLAGVVVKNGWPSRLLDAVGFGALFTWAWLELFQGSAHVRRLLGGGVLVALLVSRASG